VRRLILGLGLTLSVVAGAMAVGPGCAAGGSGTTSGGTGGAGGGASAGAGGTSASNGVGGSLTTGVGGLDAGSDAQSCAKFSAEAKQAPAAMLFVLDASASMSVGNKWGTAQLAVVQAIDKDAFDSMSLGLVTFPSSFKNPPQCLCDYLSTQVGFPLDPATCKMLVAPGVSCGVSALPQVALAPAGADKSNAPSGVRHNIYQYLVAANPLSNSDDGSPIYDALASAYNALKAYNVDKRVAVLITDGGFSCTSLANPSRPGYSDGACNDWEYPDSVNALITSARTDPSQAINTFIVGVPGSDSHGEMQGSFATAPYSMKLALSTYAVSGSPTTVDPTCDSGLTFSQSGADPAKPCHIDLSSGSAFNANALADAIQQIRGTALGCVYDLPTPPPGETIDPMLVNVDVTINGMSAPLPKRSNPTDTCATDGCWDYDANGKVEILGKACLDISAASAAKVDIQVGCTTILK